jgi:DNA polymerase-3 subunit alpha
LGFEPVEYDHPLLEPILKNTFGVCLAEGTQVYLADGSSKPIENVEVGDKILAIDQKGLVTTDYVVHKYDNGIQDVYQIVLASGRVIEATQDHRFLVNGTWRSVAQLNVGDLLAVPRNMRSDVFTLSYNVDKLRLLGYYLANGWYRGGSVEWCSKNEVLLRDFIERVTRSFPSDKIYAISCVRGVTRYLVTKKDELRVSQYHAPSQFGQWLISLGLRGKDAHNKSIPKFIFSLNDDCKAEFLAALFDCDGCVTAKTVTYKTVSRQLAVEIQKLLLLLGINSVIYLSKYTTQRNGDGEAYTVIIYDMERFYNKIGRLMISGKFSKMPDGIKRENGCIPREVIKPVVTTIKKERKVSSVANMIGVDRHVFTRKHNYIKRYVVAKLYKVIKDKCLEFALNLNWDKVKAINYVGKKRVYDLSTQTYHNFIANGIVAHNCIYQEQIMEIARVLAGYTMSDADELRKAVGKKKAEIIAKHKEKFIEGCAINGIDLDTAEKIYEKIETFGRYGFNRCIDGDELVLTTNGKHLPIKDIKPGTKLWSVNEAGKLVENEVVELIFSGIQDVYEVILDNGRSVVCTLNHKFLTSRGQFEKIGDIGVGGEILECFPQQKSLI